MEKMDNQVFTPIKIGTVELKNKFQFAAAHDNLNDCPDLRSRRYVNLTKGGVGLIVSGATNFEYPSGWKQVIDAIHVADGKIFPQIIPKRIPGVFVSQMDADSTFFHPFIFPYKANRCYSDKEINATIAQYAEISARAKSLGADGVEIHAAHHSVAAWFLSPLTNKRNDKWGGDLLKRLSFHKKIYDSVRDAVGPEFPIMIKLGVADMIEGGLDFAEGKLAAKILLEYGYDAIEVSQGLMNGHMNPLFSGSPLRPHILKPEQEAYFRH